MASSKTTVFNDLPRWHEQCLLAPMVHRELHSSDPERLLVA